MLWESESKPVTLAQVNGHEAAKQSLQEWLKPAKRKPGLVHGASGIGKTSLCMAILGSFNIWDDSMLPEGDTIGSAVDILLHRKSLVSTKRAIVIDLEGLSDLASLHKQIKGDHAIPILLTCDDIHDFPQYKSICDLFHLYKPSLDTAKTTLLQCVKRLDVQLSADSASLVLDISQGNVRNALNTLQFMVSTKKRRRTETVQLCDTSFTDQGYDLFRDAQRLCCGFVHKDSFLADSDINAMMLQHNLPSCAPGLLPLALGMHQISSADTIADKPYYLTEQSTVITVLSTALACKGARSSRLQFPTALQLSAKRQAMKKKLVEAGKVTLPSTTLGLTISQLKPNAMEALENLHVLKHIKHKDKDIQAFRKTLLKQFL